MRKTTTRRSFDFNQQKLIFILLILMFIGFCLLRPEFATAKSIDNILRTLSMYGIASMGMTLIILTGGTDLSAGSNMALAGVVGTAVTCGLWGDWLGQRFLHFPAADCAVCCNTGDDVAGPGACLCSS